MSDLMKLVVVKWTSRQQVQAALDASKTLLSVDESDRVVSYALAWRCPLMHALARVLGHDCTCVNCRRNVGAMAS